MDDDKRICATCGHELPIDGRGFQTGWYCCGEYFDTQECLDKSFVGTGETWQKHFDNANEQWSNSDCYWTEWEPETEEVTS